MSTYAEKEPQKTSLRYFKYTLVYILLIPFINWSFTWAPMVELPGLAAWAFNPVTIVTGLVLVVRDFAQREIGHEVLIAMAIALFLTYVTSGGALALASGAAFLISELVDWAMFTFTKYKLSTRVLLSSAIAAPIDTTAFLYGASFIRDAQFTVPNVVMSVGGKMFGAIIIWWLIKNRLERPNEEEEKFAAFKQGGGILTVPEFIKYSKENPSEFTPTVFEKPMEPPWMAFPDYEQYSMGWRMGGGEDYWREFRDWLPSLNQDQFEKYMTTYPEPDSWDGFYTNLLKREDM